jgi:hypothetical protein
MKNGLVIADSGPIYSLTLINKLELLISLFDDKKNPNKQSRNKITYDKSKQNFQLLYIFFNDKTSQISGLKELIFVMY